MTRRIYGGVDVVGVRGRPVSWEDRVLEYLRESGSIGNLEG